MFGPDARRATGIALLLSLAVGSTAGIALLVPGLWSTLGDLRWPLAGMVVILLISNVQRLRTQAPKRTEAAKPPHLKLISSDGETLH
ncbi:MAG: hypothetical protein WDM91_03690 [Rhizomicrobium sp.]